MARPIVAVTSITSEAEALAHELAFFLGESIDADVPSRRVHLLRGWDLKPFAAISPPSDVQASQLAALYAMRRLNAPIVITSAEALMMRTIGREDFDASVIRIAGAESLDLEIVIDTLSTMGYQRVPQCEEPGDFSVRGGIVDVFSPLYQHPVRFELEDDIVTSIRHFEAASQRSLGEIAEATIIRTRYVAPFALKSKGVLDEVALQRCGNRYGSQGSGGTRRDPRNRPAIPRRRAADALRLSPSASFDLRLRPRQCRRMADGSGPHRRRGLPPHRSHKCRGFCRAGQADIFPAARVALPNRRGDGARAVPV